MFVGSATSSRAAPDFTGRALPAHAVWSPHWVPVIGQDRGGFPQARHRRHKRSRWAMDRLRSLIDRGTSWAVFALWDMLAKRHREVNGRGKRNG